MTILQLVAIYLVPSLAVLAGGILLAVVRTVRDRRARQRPAGLPAARAVRIERRARTWRPETDRQI